MNQNIRRSIVIAAGVSGAWALGSAVASADELPAHSLSVPDVAGDTVSDVQNTTSDVQDTDSKETDKVADTQVAGKAQGAAQHAKAQVQSTVHKAAAKAKAPQVQTPDVLAPDVQAPN